MGGKESRAAAIGTTALGKKVKHSSEVVDERELLELMHMLWGYMSSKTLWFAKVRISPSEADRTCEKWVPPSTLRIEVCSLAAEMRSSKERR